MAHQSLLLQIVCVVIGLTGVQAAGWDDFANNLATDLAPFLSLFGEQVTKQYLSESITFLDYFIFAMAPMGILTAVVSAIRVCGSSSLRAFIGRAQEGHADAEAELCSSTSRDVCELYTNGGVARVFGRPKILEIVFDPGSRSPQDFLDGGKAGIYTFQEYATTPHGANEWKESSGRHDAETAMQAFAPNLSLNVGIKRKSRMTFAAAAGLGLVLQVGVMVFAAVATYSLKWEKDGRRPDPYACPLVLLGTAMVCAGVYLCALLIGQSTSERVFHRNNPRQGTRVLPSSCIFWVQPGGQVLGDQTFDAFSYSDHDDPLREYVVSWRNQVNRPWVLWVTLGVTVAGFILQFVGLRGVHSAIAVAQLGAIMVMSMARPGLRTQRLKAEDNSLARFLDEVRGHELDWLALHIGRLYLTEDPPSEAEAHPNTRCLWHFVTGGKGSELNRPMDPGECRSDGSTSLAFRLLALRTRLAGLTSQGQLARNFQMEMVEVRQQAEQLAHAITAATNTIFTKASIMRGTWGSASCLCWSLDCAVSTKSANRRADESEEPNGQSSSVCLHLERINNGAHFGSPSPWRMKNRHQIEGLLGLWLWSLKSDPLMETVDPQSHLTISRATEIPMRRIVSTDIDRLADLRTWAGAEDYSLIESHLVVATAATKLDARTVWDEQPFREHSYAPRTSRLPDDVTTTLVRYFGWHTMGRTSSTVPGDLRIWSTPAQSSMLSMCAQDLFGSYIAWILEVVDNIGDINIQKTDTGQFFLENALVSDLCRVFVERQLGTNTEALMCLLPPLITRLRLPAAGNALAAAQESADRHRQHGEWKQAEALLQWAWRICSECRASLPAGGSDNAADELTGRATIALGELYRWAMVAGKDIDPRRDSFASDGFIWLRSRRPGQSRDVGRIIDRYSDIEQRLMAQRATHDDQSLPTGVAELRAVIERDDLTSTLLLLTRWNEGIANKEKGEALCLAAKRGWTEVVRTLLDLRTEPDYKDASSRTPLSYAAQAGFVQTVMDLVKSRAFPNSDDNSHRTPLSYAAEMGCDSVVLTLLQDPRVSADAKDASGRTPLAWAAINGHQTIVQQLAGLTGVDVDAEDKKGRTPLSWACAHGHTEVVRQLLERDVTNRDSRDVKGRTPLWFATCHGHAAIVELLLQKGDVDVNAKDSDAQPPMWWAAVKGNEDIVRMLLAQDSIELNFRDVGGRTPLWLAIEHSHTAVVERFLKHQEIDVDARDSSGRTPLWISAAEGLENIVNLLLTHHSKAIDLNAQDLQGRTPLSVAAENGHVQVVKQLVEKDGVILNAPEKEHGLIPLSLAAQQGHVEVVEVLLRTDGVDINARSAIYGGTPLSLAAERGHQAVVALLLAQPNINVNTKDIGGRTPVWLATKHQHWAIVESLLSKGGADAHLDAMYTGQPVLSLAAAGLGDESIVPLLSSERVPF